MCWGILVLEVPQADGHPRVAIHMLFEQASWCPCAGQSPGDKDAGWSVPAVWEGAG